MATESSDLIFPKTFCCNCGDTNCVVEIQDTRVTRYYGMGGDTTFQLAIPICAACRKTLKRRPSGLLSRFLVFVVSSCVLYGALLALGQSVTFPTWMDDHLFIVGAILALVLVILFYRMRRARPPQTSFYQPVRVKSANVHFGDGQGFVGFMKLAFTNPDYLNVFSAANREAINAKRLSAVMAGVF